MLPRQLTSQILAHFDSADLVFLLGTRQTGFEANVFEQKYLIH
jgi:hypothetical protein